VIFRIGPVRVAFQFERERQPAVIVRGNRPWLGLIVSLTLHGLLILLLLRLLRTPPPTEQAAVPGAQRTPQETMVYVPPAPVRPPTVRTPRPTPPAEPPRPKKPDHDEPVPMTPTPSAEPEVAQRQPTAPKGAETPTETPPAAPSAQPTEVATLESEARRLFGRHDVNTGTAGPLAVRGMDVYLPENPEQCTPSPPAPGASKMDTVAGIVYEPEDHQPLPGAFLQIMGTPYVAFADQRGQYRLIFERSLVDQCRSQWVRVTASGHRAQTLLLSRGPGTTDVPLSRR
jgi:hypothetical protein